MITHYDGMTALSGQGKTRRTITMHGTITANGLQGKEYLSPTVRIVLSQPETNFVISNTEVIVDDGQEHGWD